MSVGALKRLKTIFTENAHNVGVVAEVKVQALV